MAKAHVQEAPMGPGNCVPSALQGASPPINSRTGVSRHHPHNHQASPESQQPALWGCGWDAVWTLAVIWRVFVRKSIQNRRSGFSGKMWGKLLISIDRRCHGERSASICWKPCKGQRAFPQLCELTPLSAQSMAGGTQITTASGNPCSRRGMHRAPQLPQLLTAWTSAPSRVYLKPQRKKSHLPVSKPKELTLKEITMYFTNSTVITESQNHSMFGVGRDLCGSSSPTLPPKQGHLQQAAQDILWISPEKENPQPPWAACSRVPSPSEGRSSSSCSDGTSYASVCTHCPLSCRWAPLKRVWTHPSDTYIFFYCDEQCTQITAWFFYSMSLIWVALFFLSKKSVAD